MLCKSLVLESEFDELPLHVAVFEPQGEKKGVIQILHGMCEYKERYESFMRFFVEHGFVAVCHDQRGHGDSVRSIKDWGYFYETSGNAIVEDAAQITRWIKREYPDLPITLFGHSMGSMVARCYLQNYDTLVDKAIVCGSPAKNPLAGLAIALDKCIALFCGKRHRSKMLSYLSTGKGNNNFPNEEKGAWLSSNRENINEFYSNPKGNYRFTCNGFENLFRLMKNTYKKKLYQVQNADLPIRFVSGGDDAVLGGKENFEKTVAFMREVGYSNVTGKLYEGLRHEIHNEIDSERVYADLLAFAEK
ncbi:MAG: alpha/beta hydrolase [Clostridia bacterium]|nr:alpha/beta hydrolase [Clostridia bacterium]